MSQARAYLLGAAALLLVGPGRYGGERQHRPPRFSDYPAGPIYHGQPAPVDLQSNVLAPQYRTRLRREASKGPNFAGHYTVVRWGCGTDCTGFAIVDAQTGKVGFLQPDAAIDLDYRLDSDLLVIDPPDAWCYHFGDDANDLHRMSTYDRWVADKLVFLDSLAGPPCPKQPNMRMQLAAPTSKGSDRFVKHLGAAPQLMR